MSMYRPVNVLSACVTGLAVGVAVGRFLWGSAPKPRPEPTMEATNPAAVENLLLQSSGHTSGSTRANVKKVYGEKALRTAFDKMDLDKGNELTLSEFTKICGDDYLQLDMDDNAVARMFARLTKHSTKSALLAFDSQSTLPASLSASLPRDVMSMRLCRHAGL